MLSHGQSNTSATSVTAAGTLYHHGASRFFHQQPDTVGSTAQNDRLRYLDTLFIRVHLRPIKPFSNLPGLMTTGLLGCGNKVLPQESGILEGISGLGADFDPNGKGA